jgi:hypothetical protein
MICLPVFQAAFQSFSGLSKTGVAVFRNGATTLGVETLSGGQAAFTTNKLPVGTLTITAEYSGQESRNDNADCELGC